jgi:hypothetical protein
MPTWTHTFRDSLLGKLTEFLSDAGFTCTSTHAAIVDASASLSNYHEEGVSLFPQLLLCEDIDLAARLVQGPQLVHIGTGKLDTATVKHALKQCAPLAQDGWVVFVERSKTQFRFGVMRASPSPTALGLDGTVASLKPGEATVVVLSQLAETVVQVVAPGERSLILHFSGRRQDAGDPRLAMLSLCASLTSGLSEQDGGPMRSYLESMLRAAFAGGHGCLVAVGKEIPKGLRKDGVTLSTPIDLAQPITALRGSWGADDLAAALGAGHLLRGMLQSDGITMISDSATVLGYRYFIRQNVRGLIPSEVLGGARRRAFMGLKQLVDEHELEGAFFRSSDGHAEFYSGGPR